MPGEKPKLYGDKQRPSSKRKYLEDSDDSDAENNIPPGFHLGLLSRGDKCDNSEVKGGQRL